MAILEANVEHYTLEVDGLDEQLRVIQFQGEETLSQPFRFQLELAAEDNAIDFNNVVGKNAVLAIHDADLEEVRYVNGVVSQFDQVAQKRRLTQYHLELVPHLQLLAYRYQSRIFQQQSVKDIIQQVITDANLPLDYSEFALSADYEPREYCVQYRETDLNFIQRLMEEEGIFYFFEHKENACIMHIADNESIHNEIVNPELTYNETSNLVADKNYVQALCYSRSVQSGSVLLNDFNFEKPALNLQSQSRAEADSHLQVYDYPGVFAAPERGGTLAEVMLASYQAKKNIVSGRSDCRQLLPGYLFMLANHPRDDFNQTYVITKVTQTASQPQVLEEESVSSKTSYESLFIGIPKTVTFRPPRRAVKPRIEGVQTAIVVGPAGEEIFTDQYGRVKVQFHWDLVGQQDENSSCWVRVSQLWAGAAWGAMHIPRIGQEVIVDFIEGDPDRPIITGRVYHATNTVPYKLPDEKTKSTIKSNTSPGGQTSNELLMEDKQNETQVVLSNAYGHKIIEDEKTQSLTIHTRDQHIIKLDDKNKQLSITTTNGHNMVFDDSDTENEGTMTFTSTTGYQMQLDDKNRKITAQTADGHKMELDDENKKIALTTTNGHNAIMDDDNEAIGLITTTGHYLSLSDADDAITMEDSGGAHRFKIDAGSGTLSISTDSGAIELAAPSGTISLNAVNIELTADMDCKLSGLNVTAEAGMEFKASGTMATSEASGINTVSGSLVKIN